MEVNKTSSHKVEEEEGEKTQRFPPEVALDLKQWPHHVWSFQHVLQVAKSYTHTMQQSIE